MLSLLLRLLALLLVIVSAAVDVTAVALVSLRAFESRPALLSDPSQAVTYLASQASPPPATKAELSGK